MEKIKLVIWDLDETFWKGTLSEEGVRLVEANIELLEKLTNPIRGLGNINCWKRKKNTETNVAVTSTFS